MIVSFHPEAETEFNEAIDYYENKDKGLGFDFAIEVYAALQRVVAFPEAWPFLNSKIRRALVKRFPYGVLYTLEEPEIKVLAVMHLHREPGYWKHRV